MKLERHIQAGQFKARCLQLMDEVNDKHHTFIITKHGKPVAMLVPVDDAPKDAFGCLKGTITIQGDILEPIDSGWEANE